MSMRGRWREMVPAMRVYAVVSAVVLLVCLSVVIVSTVQHHLDGMTVFALITTLGILAIAMIPVSIIDRRHQLDAIVRRAEDEDRK